jgi:hypothetical protein
MSPIRCPSSLGKLVVEAGMSATAQCQKPLPVGACGSYMVTTKVRVSAGKPDHDSCGEASKPPGAGLSDVEREFAIFLPGHGEGATLGIAGRRRQLRRLWGEDRKDCHQDRGR